MFRFVLIAALLVAGPFATGAGWACPLCNPGGGGITIAGEYNQASMIIIGTLKNPVQNFEDPRKNTTEFHITEIIKDHPFLKGKKMVILPRYFPPPDPTKPDEPVLVFAGLHPQLQDSSAAALVSGAILADFNRYTFDPYRGDVLQGKSEMAAYMKKVLAIADKPMAERLKFYFEFLDAQDLAVGSDAYTEFANADYADIRKFAETNPQIMDKLTAWLKDPNTAPSRFGLYGLLLGHSKNKEHAKVLRELLDAPRKFYASGIDGILGGYVLLDPAEGWPYLEKLTNEVEHKFETRYAALRTLRFFWEFRPDVIEKAKMLKVYRTLLKQDDIADMPIEDMRKLNCDELAADIVSMSRDEETMKNAFVRRSLVKYLITASARRPEAATAVNDLKAKHPDWVKNAEESLEFDKSTDSKIATPDKVP